MEDHSLAFDMLTEMKKTQDWQRQCIKWILILGACLVLLVVGVFAFMWLQYDYVVESHIDAHGIFTAVNESGVIVTQEVTPEVWDLFMEWLNEQQP